MKWIVSWEERGAIYLNYSPLKAAGWWAGGPAHWCIQPNQIKPGKLICGTPTSAGIFTCAVNDRSRGDLLTAKIHLVQIALARDSETISC